MKPFWAARRDATRHKAEETRWAAGASYLGKCGDYIDPFSPSRRRERKNKLATENTDLGPPANLTKCGDYTDAVNILILFTLTTEGVKKINWRQRTQVLVLLQTLEYAEIYWFFFFTLYEKQNENKKSVTENTYLGPPFNLGKCIEYIGFFLPFTTENTEKKKQRQKVLIWVLL